MSTPGLPPVELVPRDTRRDPPPPNATKKQPHDRSNDGPGVTYGTTLLARTCGLLGTEYGRTA